jgi:hypothetical protein
LALAWALLEADGSLVSKELVPDRRVTPPARLSLSKYLTKIARLGGYLARANDPPPGNVVIWRSLARLTDIKLALRLQEL